MTGPRDYAGEWAAVYGATYAAEHRARVDFTGSHATSDESCDELARYAASVADEAVRALHRVRGGEP